jgi:GntR family transcriptional repressor for pyruvate dehydrogenase complex
MAPRKTMFVPVRGKRTFEEVSSQIKRLILEGALKPGDKLPSETKLAEQFDVGRTTIREALRILELSGFLTVQKGFGGGSVVKDTILKKMTSLLLDAFQMEKITVNEFTAARLVIEKAILTEAIEHADKQDIENLRRNIEKTKEVIAAKEMATDIGFQFHSLLAKSSKNTVFVILEGAINAIHRNLAIRSLPNFREAKRWVCTHEEMIDAIVKKDLNKAIRLLEKDVFSARTALRAK